MDWCVSNTMLSGVMSKHDFAISRSFFMANMEYILSELLSVSTTELNITILFHQNHLPVINAIKNAMTLLQKETYFLPLKHPYIPAMLPNWKKLFPKQNIYLPLCKNKWCLSKKMLKSNTVCYCPTSDSLFLPNDFSLFATEKMPLHKRRSLSLPSQTISWGSSLFWAPLQLNLVQSSLLQTLAVEAQQQANPSHSNTHIQRQPKWDYDRIKISHRNYGKKV